MWLSGIFATCSGVPSATTCPPPSPPSGPRSTIQSADLIDVEVVLDHEHGVARVDQPLQHAEQPAHVLEVQAGGRLVEDVDGVAGRPLAELASPA